jgi:hypothetical protein
MRIDRELTTKCWVGFIDWLDAWCGTNIGEREELVLPQAL